MNNMTTKMNFADYYKNVSELQAELRSLVCSKLDISLKTFYNRINDDSWSDMERATIDKVVLEFNTKIATVIK